MSTPQTLTQTLPPHQHLDHRQRYLPSPQDRYLPPPRPSSNLSSGYHQNIPTRPSSNLSNRQLPPPPRAESGIGSTAYAHHQSQSRGGADYAYSNGTTQQANYDHLRRTESHSTQYQRTLPPLPPQQTSSTSRASAVAAAEMPAHASAAYSNHYRSGSVERGRKRRVKSPVDWVAFFGGKPPAEIIEIHDDDSPAPSATVHRAPAQANGSSSAQHADKRRRVNGGSGDAPQYSTTNTPYSYTNGTSTESLQATTAPTSLGSQASSGASMTTAQSGQKRKRETKSRTTEAERKKQEVARPGAPRGYLAEYGEYQTPPRQVKKQKDVVVPAIHDVRWSPPFVEAWTGLTCVPA